MPGNSGQRLRRRALSLSQLLCVGGRLPVYVIVSLVALYYTEEHGLQTATGMFVGIGLMYTTGMVLSLLMGAKA